MGIHTADRIGLGVTFKSAGCKTEMTESAGHKGITIAEECQADPEEPPDLVEYHARALADAMKAIHGGSWRINIVHNLGMVQISRAVT